MEEGGKGQRRKRGSSERLVCPWDRYSLCPRLPLHVQREGEKANPSSLFPFAVISTNFFRQGARGGGGGRGGSGTGSCVSGMCPHHHGLGPH